MKTNFEKFAIIDLHLHLDGALSSEAIIKVALNEGIELPTYNPRELDKYLLDLPMEEPKLLHPTIMKNILGQDVKDYNSYRKIPFAFIHDYGKSENRVNRKMGHITFTGIDEETYNKYKSEVLK